MFTRFIGQLWGKRVELATSDLGVDSMLAVDLEGPAKGRIKDGPRVCFLRTVGNDGWKLVVHKNGNEDPDFCVHINDADGALKVVKEGEEGWPD